MCRQRRGAEIAVVASEHFVAAVAGERDRHLLAREAADEMGRNLRAVGERLVVHRRQQRDDVLRLADGDVTLIVVGSEMGGDFLRIFGLVEAGFLEADREGPHRPRRIFLIEADHGRAVDPARQEGADRHVRHGLTADRLGEGGFEQSDRFRLVLDRVGEAGGDDRAIGPVRRDRDGAGAASRRGRIVEQIAPGVGAGGEDAARRQLEQAAVDGKRRRNVGSRGEHPHRASVDLVVEAVEATDRLELGGEDEASRRPAPVERLLAEAVAGKVELPVTPVPEGEGEHPDRLLQRRLEPPGGDALDQRLGVAVAAPGDAVALRAAAVFVELGAHRGVIVDLAVVDDHPAPVVRDHRLVAERGEIEDREAAMAETDADFGVQPAARVVGAAMDDAVGHPRQ
jgi:hypothetical protein